ncbi:MAG: hypothetical protein ACE5JA_03165 [bacterium]
MAQRSKGLLIAGVAAILVLLVLLVGVMMAVYWRDPNEPLSFFLPQSFMWVFGLLFLAGMILPIIWLGRQRRLRKGREVAPTFGEDYQQFAGVAESRFCPECGMRGEHAFCPSCGAQMKEVRAQSAPGSMV